jgi:hypothetical protein
MKNGDSGLVLRMCGGGVRHESKRGKSVNMALVVVDQATPQHA